MKTLGLSLLLVSAASVVGQPAAAQKSDVPAPKKAAVTKPAATQTTQKPTDTRKDKPQPKDEARPVARRVAPPPALAPPLPSSPGRYLVEVYKGDVPNDPGMRSWQPPPRGQR